MKKEQTLRQKSWGQGGRAHSGRGSGGPYTLCWGGQVGCAHSGGGSSGPCTLWWSGINSAVTQNFCKFIMDSTGGGVSQMW